MALEARSPQCQPGAPARFLSPSPGSLVLRVSSPFLLLSWQPEPLGLGAPLSPHRQTTGLSEEHCG